MSKQDAEIPILGLDTRPLQRQAAGGLCSDISNLRPHGPTEDPYWRAVPEPGQLKNSSGVAFSHPKQGQIVDSYYLVQNRNVPGGQSERLLLVFSDGSLDVVDPEGDGDWRVITSYDFEEETGPWEADFAVVGEILAIAISKDDMPYRLVYLYQDQIIPYGFPDLPILSMRQIQTQEYSDTQIEAGTHTGLRNGKYGYRYGFRIAPGKNVMLSPPIPFTVSNPANVFSELEFTLVGYTEESKPENYAFWKKLLEGIDVYVSDRHESKADVLLDGLFYNVVSFSSIDQQVDYIESENPNIKLFAGREEDLSTNLLFDVDDGSFHRLAASTIHGYNSRLALGRVAVDFAEPPVSIYYGSATNIEIVRSEFTENFETFPDEPWYLDIRFTLTAAPFGLPGPANGNDNRIQNLVIDPSDTLLIHREFWENFGSNTIHCRLRIELEDGPTFDPDTPVSFDVIVQAYRNWDATDPVGEPVTFHYERP